MKPPPEVVDDAEDVAPEPTVTSALEIAAKYSGSASEQSIGQMSLPGVRQPVNDRFVSAPVSRETTSWTGRREDRPGRITLSVAQREAARISGLTDVQYAQQLIRLREEKAADPDRYGADR
jgi:hypothetical protein